MTLPAFAAACRTAALCCCRCGAGRAAIDRYLLPAGPIAANPPHAAAAGNWDSGWTDTVPLHRPWSAYTSRAVPVIRSVGNRNGIDHYFGSGKERECRFSRKFPTSFKFVVAYSVSKSDAQACLTDHRTACCFCTGILASTAFPLTPV